MKGHNQWTATEVQKLLNSKEIIKEHLLTTFHNMD